MAKEKILVGLTGNLGSGKSTVGSFFKELGADVINADEIGHIVLKQVKDEIIQKFGDEITDESGEINRRALAYKAFTSKESVEALNNIVKPHIIRLIDDLVKKSKARIVVVDGALIFEYNMENYFDYIVYVYTPEGTSIERFMKRTGYPEDMARRILSYQIPADLKKEKADFIIENTGTIEELKEKAKKVWDELTKDP